MIPQIKKILYATDLTKNSSYAFLYAVDMAKRHGAKIVIFHAIEPIRAYLLPEGGINLYQALERGKEEERKADIEAIKNHLLAFCKKVETELGPPCLELVSNTLVRVGYPPAEILNVVDEEQCDAIVLGTHGKGFLAHTFLGSVSSSVLHRTRKPVFIIPLPSEKTAIDYEGV
jgi:nucleotide-binding universal stress UspA family protein